MFHSNSLLYPPISTSFYKIEILLFSSFASFFTKMKIVAKQLAFMYFLLFANVLWIFDEIFFPSYKRVQIKKPIFLLGGFRTGTTIVHRSLYEKRTNFISPRFLELLFPFLCVQYFFDALEYCDTSYQTSFIAGIDFLLLQLFGNKIMSKHFISYDTPEEDDILLSTYMGVGWYNIVQFPFFESWKAVGNLSLLSEQEKKRIGSFYHQCMQKILFRRGKEKQFLNKTHLIALYPFWKLQYPDAKFFLIERNQTEALRSFILLNQFTNERFFGIQYSEHEYKKYHMLFWEEFEFAKKNIECSGTLLLEDFCANKETELSSILEKIEQKDI